MAFISVFFKILGEPVVACSQAERERGEFAARDLFITFEGFHHRVGEVINLRLEAATCPAAGVPTLANTRARVTCLYAAPPWRAAVRNAASPRMHCGGFFSQQNLGKRREVWHRLNHGLG